MNAFEKSLLEYIPDNDQLNILDIGCGTGRMTEAMSKKSSNVLGIDKNYHHLNTARKKYPHLNFKLMDALDLAPNRKWDIVFSNMAFHAIEDHDTLLKKISKALKQSGTLICEFGAKGNAETIETAVKNAFKTKGTIIDTKFNYASEEEFKELLSNNGFSIDVIRTHEQFIPLENGKEGLRDFILTYYDKDIAKFSIPERVEILENIENNLRDKLWNGKEWLEDHKRLKVVAYTQ